MPGRRSLSFLALAALTFAAARPATAQVAGGDGFSFAPPGAALTLRAGWTAPNAGGDLFDFAQEPLTLSRGDFRGLAYSADLAYGPRGGRWDVVLGAGYASSRPTSEYEQWLGEDDLPIAQTTTFRRVPLTVGLRAYPMPRGRSVGRLAWVPAPVVPYIGAGVGATWYRFAQSGEFVDFESPDPQSPDIFRAQFRTSGWGPTAYGGAGFDYTLSPALALTLDARYVYAKAGVAGDYEGFDDIDLSGLSATIGITFRY